MDNRRTLEAFDRHVVGAAHAFSYGMEMDEVVDMLSASTDTEGDAYLIAKAAKLYEKWFHADSSETTVKAARLSTQPSAVEERSQGKAARRKGQSLRR